MTPGGVRSSARGIGGRGGRRKGKQKREKLRGGRDRGKKTEESPGMVESTFGKPPLRDSGWPG